MVKAQLRYLRVSPRKVRLLADLIRGKSVEKAQIFLKFVPKRASEPLSKLLRSAVANAKNNFQLEEKNLYISKITVDEGPKYKRWMPRARGQAGEIQKKTSHITIVLDEFSKKAGKIKKAKSAKTQPVGEEKIEKKIKQEGKASAGRAKFRPAAEAPKPKAGGVMQKIFRRKSF